MTGVLFVAFGLWTLGERAISGGAGQAVQKTVAWVARAPRRRW